MPRKAKENTEIVEEKTTKKATASKSTANKKTAKPKTKKVETTASKAKNSVTKSSVKTTKKPTKTTSKKSTTTDKKASSKSTKKTTKSSTAQKNAKKEKVEIIEYYDLPYRYNQTVVKVLAQTPNTLFVYWDISDEDKNKYIEEYGEYFFNNTKPVLIIHPSFLTCVIIHYQKIGVKYFFFTP